MNYSHYRISLDIHSTQSQVSLPIKQGDTSRKVLISLCEGGKPYHIEDDCYAVFSARKPDGKVIEDYCIIANGVIEYTITEQTSAVSGMHNCEIKLYGGDHGLITSPRLTIIVDARAVSDADIDVESRDDYSALTNLYTITNAAANNANEAAETARTSAANADAKATLASEATQTANDSAANANAKADLANEAANNANEARDGANTAATTANESARLADIAADNANSKAEIANIATSEANTARDNANASASNANTAAGNANAKAGLASKAASDANNKIAEMQTLGQYIATNVILPTEDAKNAANTAATAAKSAATAATTAATEANEARVATEEATANANTAAANANTAASEIRTAELSNAFKGSASGEVVTLTDVSSLTHEMKVKVSNPSATLTKSGKNILPYPFYHSYAEIHGVDVADNGDGSLTLNGTATSDADFYLHVGTLSAGTYTYRLADSLPEGIVGNVVLRNKNGDWVQNLATCTKEKPAITFAITKDVAEEYKFSFTFYIINKRTVNLTIYPQLELGSTATAYEPYAKPITYTPNSDGTVDGVTSLYPTTILSTDTAGVTIDVEYNRDSNKVVADLIAFIRSMNRISYIDLAASKWQGSASPFSQVVDIEGVTENSFVEFCFSTEQIETFRTKDVSFTVKNNNGVITVNCVGQKPTADYRLQVKITEVQINE